jgi:hypothetical protein
MIKMKTMLEEEAEAETQEQTKMKGDDLVVTVKILEEMTLIGEAEEDLQVEEEITIKEEDPEAEVKTEFH